MAEAVVSAPRCRVAAYPGAGTAYPGGEASTRGCARAAVVQVPAMKWGRATGLCGFSLVTRAMVVDMETITATRYQSRLYDTAANRAILTRAMYGKPVDFDALDSPTLACTARLLSACVREYGVAPTPLRTYRGWPREKIFRPDVDRIIVNVIAAETTAGINVYVSAAEIMTSNVVGSRFFQRGCGKHFGMVYSCNTDALFGDEPSPLLGPGFVHHGSADWNMFTADELGRVHHIDNVPEVAPVVSPCGSEAVANTTTWDSSVFGGTMKREGHDLAYDDSWCQMQIATARLTPREQ